jgi:hypothetical protein
MNMPAYTLATSGTRFGYARNLGTWRNLECGP